MKKGKIVGLGCGVAVIAAAFFGLTWSAAPDEDAEGVAAVSPRTTRTVAHEGNRRKVLETAKQEARAAIRRSMKAKAQEAAMEAAQETDAQEKGYPNQVMPEGPLSAADQEIVEVADEAVSDKDFETAQDVAAEALKSSDARVRVQAVETLMGFGETALPELAGFLNDSNHEVAVLAADRFELAVQEIEDDAERVAVAKLGVLSIDDPDELLAMMGTLRMSTDETAVLTALSDIIRDGSAAQAKVAREAYREETGDEWTTPEAVRAWLIENDYPVPEMR